MIWQRKNATEWFSYLDDDDNDITRWFLIQRMPLRMQTSSGFYICGYLPRLGAVPGQPRIDWMQPLTTYPFKTFKGAETICMMEYENLIAT